MPRLTDLKETALYVAGMERARAFWEGVMGLEPMVADARFCAYDVAGRHVLLLFATGESARDNVLPGGVIPPARRVGSTACRAGGGGGGVAGLDRSSRVPGGCD